MSSEKVLKSAIVGCGGIARVHAKSLKAMEEAGGNAKLIAVCDIKPERAEDFAASYQAKPYTSLDEMLEKEEIDVLHICTPHYLHVPMIGKAVRKGINVFSEKPPVISYEQWAELEETMAASSGARLAFCFQNRYNDSVQYVRRLAAENTFGELRGIRGLVSWKREAPYYQDSDWRGRLETEGGGVLINQSIHTLDLMQYLVGKQAEQVEAVMDNQHLQGVMEVEDTMAAFIRYPGVTANFYATTAYAADAPVQIDLVYEKANVRIEEKELTISSADGQIIRKTFDAKPELGKSYWGTGHPAAIADFYHAVLSGEPCMIDWETAADTARLFLDIYASARGKASR